MKNVLLTILVIIILIITIFAGYVFYIEYIRINSYSDCIKAGGTIDMFECTTPDGKTFENTVSDTN
jgi:hypothetical protein